MESSAAFDTLCINTIRTLAMDAVQKANSGHPGAPLGLAPVAYTLYSRFLKFDPANPDWPNRDRFVLSAGHASMLLYAALHLSGFDLSLDDIKNFRQLHSKTAGHPEYGLAPGIETTTGPLGQGAGNSVGMAIAEKWLAARYNRGGHSLIDYKVFALLGDGCMMEGVTGEAASLAGHLGLDNLIWIYDNNGITIDGTTDITYSDNVAQRFEAFGWRVRHVHDANELDALCEGLTWATADADRPALLIVDSVIGYGAPTRAGKSKAHGEPLGEEEIVGAKKAYGWDPQRQFHIPDEVRAHMTDGARKRGADLHAEWQNRLERLTAAHPELADEWHTMQRGELPSGWDSELPSFEPDEKGMASRVSGSKALGAISVRVPWMMGGAADLVGSTKTSVPESEDFARGHWRGRNINFGVREHAMAAVANGLALSKIRPFASTFLTFADYCRPSIRLSAIMRLPVIYAFTHDSIGLGEDGPTHQPVEHLASLRCIPHLDVYRPCDANEAVEAWRSVMQTTDRPALLALSRQNLPTLDRARYGPANGVARGAYVIADCQGEADLLIMASGSEVHVCLSAREILAGDGVKARVISMPCWELFERQSSAYREEVLPSGVTARVAVEAGVSQGWHQYVGSGGTTLCLSTFGESAPLGDLMQHFGFTGEKVAAVCRTALKASVD